ncbi:AAA family ATPase [Candidatus Pacearchaeota archaeon]|nr:AAA family ATPase [Candidatus Pacearchaeota archaeon]
MLPEIEFNNADEILAQISKTELQTKPLANYDMNESEDFKILNESELRNYVATGTAWILANFIRHASIVILAGKRSSLKSWGALQKAICVATGKSFLGKFETEKSNVLYLDKENGFEELQKRVAMIKTGLEINENVNMHFISETSLKLDSRRDILKLIEIIREKKIHLVVVDALRRFISFDENDAKEVSNFITEYIKPLCEGLNVSFLFIHHERKGESSGDDMDMLRGSSDLANYADCILQVMRKGDYLTVKQTKSRSGKELEPFQVKIETDELTFFRLIYHGAVERREDKVAQMLTNWFVESKIISFQYFEGLKYVKSLFQKESSYKNALLNLQTQGVIKKGDGWRASYKVDTSLLGYHEKH